jgi:hypothetical protein
MKRSKPFIDSMPPVICKAHGREDCGECMKGSQGKSVMDKVLDWMIYVLLLPFVVVAVVTALAFAGLGIEIWGKLGR